MGDRFRAEPAELHAFADYMRELAADFSAVNDYVNSEGCDTAGFAGLLAELQPAVQRVGGRYRDAIDLGRDRLEGSAEGLHRVADKYERADADQAAAVDDIAGQLPGGD